SHPTRPYNFPGKKNFHPKSQKSKGYSLASFEAKIIESLRLPSNSQGTFVTLLEKNTVGQKRPYGLTLRKIREITPKKKFRKKCISARETVFAGDPTLGA
ncbi:Zinc finger protein 644, partial [Frankliniella fusca]